MTGRGPKPGSHLPQKIAQSILDLIAAGEIGVGEHLSTPKLAERFDVSRSPVREALHLLAERGAIAQERNRGFFVQASSVPAPDEAQDTSDEEPVGYLAVAGDWLRDRIPAEVTEQFLRERFALSAAQLARVLALGSSEGWAERRSGYGWRLLPVAKTPDALEQIYRVRLVVEPAGLLEPSFRLDRRVLDAQRATQRRLLDGGIRTLPATALVSAGAQIHEDILRMSGNPFLAQTLVRLNRVRRLIEYQSMVDRERLYRQCREHLDLLDLIERGQNVDASHFLRSHLNDALLVKLAIHRAGAAAPAP
ncbi:GntR family transcriptional regulator [Methylobacterium sp. NEAU 140]|uniref:GntR family transcriptional regulator n=1 Tax=Methylobacterium sp. NEAU 140 TaxID=3064945 RepID=UPI002736B455|nr:GntR family transcriptional regulator [Methylobacterium sp. NEAU 140]MDP4024283.1 GntR family transcriptional regulator [Methylobacterium sp. NEAU 140]